MDEPCPKARADEMIQGHLMRLVKGGDREVWKCARDCGFTRIAPNPFLKEKQPP